jgi:hypothetical protein
LLIGEINGLPAREAPFASALAEAGFSPSSRGLLKRANLRAKVG